MHPLIHLFGKEIPSYGLCAVLGVCAAMLFTVLFARRRGLDTENAVYILAMGGVGALLGAKVLYLLTVLPQFLGDLPLLLRGPNLFVSRYLAGGFVFYGGLLGGIGTAWHTAKGYHGDLRDYARVLAPATALFAGIGRIGCLMTGCCYGRETDLPIGMRFDASPVAPHGVALIPTQLIEALFDFALAAVLWRLGREGSRASRHLIGIYLGTYAAFRFLLEFLRADEARGSLGWFSTSQWISIGALIILTIIFLSERKRDHEV